MKVINFVVVILICVLVGYYSKINLYFLYLDFNTDIYSLENTDQNILNDNKAFYTVNYNVIPPNEVERLKNDANLVWDDRNMYALIIVNPQNIQIQYGLVDGSYWLIDLGGDRRGIEVVCDDLGNIGANIYDYFSKLNTEFNTVQAFFNELFPVSKIDDYDPNVEHSLFFFEYDGKICHPYPLLLIGYETEVTDSRLTIFNAWNIKEDSETSKGELLLIAHNHPASFGFVEYASADDYSKPFFVYNADGIVVAGNEGFHVVRKKVDNPSTVCDYKKDIKDPVDKVADKYKKMGINYIGTKEYREEVRSIIFSNINVQKALEQFFYLR